MSNEIMSKSYTVVCQRKSGQTIELETVAGYGDAYNTAKTALANKNNLEVRIVENKYDAATRKDKKQVIKILRPEGARDTANHRHGSGQTHGISRDVANKATKSIINIVLAATILILLVGVLLPLAMR